MDTNVIQLITMTCSIIGAVIGGYTAARTFMNDRVRLKVTPKIAAFGDHSLKLCVEVINKSTFDVTINALGFVVAGSKVVEAFDPELLYGQQFPAVLKPRASLTGFGRPGTEQRENLGLYKSVIAYTACGNQVRGTSAALLAFAKHRPSAGFPAQVVDYDPQKSGFIVSSPNGVPKAYQGKISA